MMKHWAFFACLFAYAVTVQAQLPKTNIYVFDYTIEGDSLLLSNPQWLTQFNQDGYNNQPYFLDEERLFITSNWQEEQTDIYLLDLAERSMTRVTNTIQSEYSPTRLPNSRSFSVIRVEPQLDNAQFLWRYPMDRSNEGSAIFEDVRNVGYHTWLNSKDVALFLVNEPRHTLALGDATSGTHHTVIEDIGRTLLTDESGRLLFIDKISRKYWYIKRYDADSGRARIIAQTKPGKEDFGVLNDGSFVMGDGSILYRFVDGLSRDWVAVADLSQWHIRNITRIRTFGQKIAIVHASQ